MPSEGLRFPQYGGVSDSLREPRATVGDHHCSQDYKDEDGGNAKNTGYGDSGASCYLVLAPLPAISYAGDNYDNKVGGRLLNLGRTTMVS